MLSSNKTTVCGYSATISRKGMQPIYADGFKTAKEAEKAVTQKAIKSDMSQVTYINNSIRKLNTDIENAYESIATITYMIEEFGKEIDAHKKSLDNLYF